MFSKELHTAIEASLSAGKAILEIYENEDFQVESKNDDSPLTIADKKANDIINSYLFPTAIPVISEENKQTDYNIRKNWTRCWIVDPLDGTKEFIRRNGEFTVNIALIQNEIPVLGVIFAPAQQILYFALAEESKAYKVNLNSEKNINLSKIYSEAIEIKPKNEDNLFKIVGSRSHMNEETLQFIKEIESRLSKETEIVSKGSSLKFCLIAEGKAQIYPRFAPTMEWDTAAGQAICESVGLQVKERNSGKSLRYNKVNLLNPQFVVNYEK